MGEEGEAKVGDNHDFRKEKKGNLDLFVGAGAISIGIWFLWVICIVQGGCTQGSPSICIGNLFLVRMTTEEHCASRRPEALSPALT